MKWNQLAVKLGAVFTVFFSGMVFAHDATGNMGSIAAGVLHPLTGLDHALVMIAVGGWAAQLAYQQHNTSVLWKVPVAFVLAMTVSALLAMVGVGISASIVEPGIGLSAVLIGLLLTAGLNVSARFGALIVAGFAVFHGLAHGAEIPFEAGVIGYCLGFIFSTALLHAIGAILFSFMLPRQDKNRHVGHFTKIIGVAISLSGVYSLSV
ncbi:HupE/UreJ family protein [Vibrio penaeicida]|uniref:HupE/UreJ family protein n=1 Tax=Vibrio penaeicida TaxID=104609 RepID=UPI0027339C59|nr:HupE/UreJ family protein [Vibrio penaeicida]MDP2574241.1 HupE/UreJ family protein [Vibrio penaeicida]